MLKVGFARRVISPPIGVRLAGFGARRGTCEGVHDDLYARALVLRQEESMAALVSLDLLALPASFVNRVRQAIQERTGIPASAILLASTHTHAAPVTLISFFNPGDSLNANYLDSLASAIEASVMEAFETAQPARAGMGSGRVRNVAVNRRSADGKPVDEEVGILKIDGPNGRTLAVLMNYACHPTVLGPDNLLASGDFPAPAVARVEESLGAGSFALFVNGAEGDVSVGHSSEMSAIGVIAPGRTFERAEELGARVAAGVLEALPSITTSESPVISARVKTISLPLKKYPPPGETAATLHQTEERLAALNPESKEYRHAQSELLYASITNFYAGETAGGSDTLPVEIQAIRVGDAALVAVPAEVFVEIGMRIKTQARRRTFVVAVANGYIGYLPDRKSYPKGGYEVVSAKVNADAEDRLAEGVLHLTEELFA